MAVKLVELRRTHGCGGIELGTGCGASLVEAELAMIEKASDEQQRGRPREKTVAVVVGGSQQNSPLGSASEGAALREGSHAQA